MKNEIDFYQQLAERWGVSRNEAKLRWLSLWYATSSIATNPEELKTREELQKVWR